VVVSIGHGIPEIREAILQQASEIAFTHGTHFTSEAAVELAERIVSLSPQRSPGFIFYPAAPKRWKPLSRWPASIR